MSSNVGLSTPRGSGTSGYVQRNISHLRPRDNPAPYPKDFESAGYHQRQPDKEILDHDRKRKVELKVFEARVRMEDEECDEDEIEEYTSALRAKLLAEYAAEADISNESNARGLKRHQVHELAQAKIEESEKVRKALGISADYEEGSHWRRQDEKQREANFQGSRGDNYERSS